MATPPPLSAASADRMASVVEAADGHVDGGMAPDVALAKAASEAGLPFGHVPLVVRAFNTARAVRQLEEQDVWAKAAAYPVATEDGVKEALAAPQSVSTTKQARNDYAAPPILELPKEPAPHWSPVPALPTHTRTKAASAPLPKTTLAAQFDAAQAFDAAAAAVRPLPRAEYAGVKKVACRLHPQAAEFFFTELEASVPACLQKAAGAASPAVGVDHPAVRLIGRLEAVKASYVSPTPVTEPEGYRKVASEPGVALYRKKADPVFDMADPATWLAKKALSPRVIPPAPAGWMPKEKPDSERLKESIDGGINDLLQTPGTIPPTPVPMPPPTPMMAPPMQSMTPAPSPMVNAPPIGPGNMAVPPPAPPAAPIGPTGPTSGAYQSEAAAPPAPKMAAATTPAASSSILGNFSKGFGRGFSPISYLAQKDYIAPAVSGLGVSSGGDGGIGKATRGLESGLSQLDQQSDIQELLSDPRFAKADPKMVMDSYRSLSGIAPSAMRNPAIAADFINRRLQTGPPSYYDLKVLTDLETNLAKIRDYNAKANTKPDDDED